MSIRQSDVSALLNGLNKKAIGFNDVISFIDDFYRYAPAPFVNGMVHNAEPVRTKVAQRFLVSLSTMA